MVERICEFQTPVSEGERLWRVEAWGAQRDDGRWEGWLQFVPTDGGLPLVTGRETTQSTREALVYWAQGLAAIYFEGALSRARSRAA
jgi:hypothetical protein